MRGGSEKAVFGRFFLINLGALGVDALLFALLADGLKLAAPVAVAVGVIAGAVFAYVGHSLITFNNRKALTGGWRYVGFTALRFGLIIALVYGVRVVIVAALLPWVPLATVAYVPAVGVSFVLNFVLSRWLFGRAG